MRYENERAIAGTGAALIALSVLSLQPTTAAAGMAAMVARVSPGNIAALHMASPTG